MPDLDDLDTFELADLVLCLEVSREHLFERRPCSRAGTVINRWLREAKRAQARDPGRIPFVSR